MPHVVTQSCCSDGSCVYACPVNCIHPTPDEPGFATAEMLYVDPVACVDCGACVSACPVGAIVPDSRLTPEQLPFAAINAAHYPPRPDDVKLPPTSKLATVLPAPRVRRGAAPLTVAVVGSGPAAMYAADELLTQDGVRVNVFEKLPTPYGLVRAGVAPDHQSTKAITSLFDRISRRRGFTFYLNVEVGSHLSHSDLLEHHHAVLYAVGAAHDRRLDVDGMGLPGTATATETVAWINGHPDAACLPVDLGHERAVVIGNGNVALDVARILTADPTACAHRHLRCRTGCAAYVGGPRGGRGRAPRAGRLGVHAAGVDRADRSVRRRPRRRRPRPGPPRPGRGAGSRHQSQAEILAAFSSRPGPPCGRESGWPTS
ncbi:MAG: 4Fe-4S binding protein [Micropruina sp.]